MADGWDVVEELPDTPAAPGAAAPATAAGGWDVVEETMPAAFVAPRGIRRATNAPAPDKTDFTDVAGPAIDFVAKSIVDRNRPDVRDISRQQAESRAQAFRPDASVASLNQAELAQRERSRASREAAATDPWRAVGATIESTPGMARQILGGAVRAIGEGPLDKIGGSDGAIDPTGEFQGRTGSVGQSVAQFGADVADQGRAIEEDANRGIKRGTTTKVIDTAWRSALMAIPAAAIGALTRSPTLVVSIMAGEDGALSYEEAREKGLNSQQAAGYALMHALIEGGTEYIPVKELLKKEPNVLKHALMFLAKEQPSELAATTLQSGLDKLTIRPDMTAREFGEELLMTVLSTPLSAGAQVGAVRLLTPSGAEQPATLPAASAPPPEPTPQPVAAAPAPVPANSPAPPPLTPTTAAAADLREVLADERPLEEIRQEQAQQAQAEEEQRVAQQAADAGFPAIGEVVVAKTPAGPLTGAVQAIEDGMDGPLAVFRTADGRDYRFAAGEVRFDAPEGDGTRTAPVVARDAQDVARAAQVADTEATPAQKVADNYQKAWFTFADDSPMAQLGRIAIETPQGATRTAADGTWSVPDMPAHYGHLSIAKGNDGDGADVFIGNDLAAPQVYVIDQIDPDTGRYDETKSMVGFSSENAAVAAYIRSFSDGRGPDRIGALTAMPVGQFVARARADNLRMPVAYVQPSEDALELADYDDSLAEVAQALEDLPGQPATLEELMAGIGFTDNEIKEALNATQPVAEGGAEAAAAPVAQDVAPAAPQGGDAVGGEAVQGGEAPAGAGSVGAEQLQRAGAVEARPTNTPGSELPNGFRRGPSEGSRYRVNTISAVGGAVQLEKRSASGSISSFYVGANGGLVDVDSVALNKRETFEGRLWIPSSEAVATEARQILDAMGRLEINDPARDALKTRLKELVEGDQAGGGKPATPAAPAALPDSPPVSQPDIAPSDYVGMSDAELRQIGARTRTPKVAKAISDELARRRREATVAAPQPETGEQRANFDRQQEIMASLPSNMGPRIRDGKVTATQQALMDELDRLQKELPQTSDAWAVLMKEARDRHGKAMDAWRAENRARAEKEIADAGFAEDQRVTMFAPSMLGPIGGGQTYRGKVIITRNGHARVRVDGGEYLALRGNPWRAEAEPAKSAAKEYLAEVEAAKQRGAELAKVSRETVTPAEDTPVGTNRDGDPLYERKDGSRYAMRNGRPDFGGDLAPVEEVAPKNPEQPAPPPVAESQAPAPSEPGDRGVAPTREAGGRDQLPDAGKKIESKETDQQYSRRIMREMAERKKEQDAEAAKAAEEAKYQPFNAADIKKPTPSSMGLTPSTASWYTGLYEGRSVWTNRKIVDFAGGPKGVEKGLASGGAEARLPVDKIVPADPATVPGVPVTIYHVDGKEVEYVVGLKFGDKVAAIDRDYFAYFTTAYPGATFMVEPGFIEDGKGAGVVRVMRDGEMIGLISQVRMDDAFRAKVREMASDQPPPTPVAESQDDEAWLRELFSETAATPEPEQKQGESDLTAVRAAIASVRAATERDLADWESRTYKQNKSQVEFRGDGPARRESMSIGAINAGRRDKAIAAFKQQLAALDKIEARIATSEGAREFKRMLDETWRKAVEGVKVDPRFKTAGELFETLVLRDLQPAQGSTTSNPLSRALLALVEPGDRGVAPAQEKGAAEPAPAIFGLSGAQLEAMQGGKLRGAEQFTGVAPTEQQVADRKALVAKRKADEAAAVDKAALDPRIAALRESGVEAGILLKAEKELKDGDDSLIKDLARIQGIELPAEPKAESVGEAPAPPAAKPAPQKPTPAASLFQAHFDTMKALNAGTLSVDGYKSAFQRLVDGEAEVKAELGKKNKDELLANLGGFRRRGETKAEVVNDFYDAMLRAYRLGKEYGPNSYIMSAGGLAKFEADKRKALIELVANQTQDDLDAYAAERRKDEEAIEAKRAELRNSVEDPKTLEQFRDFIRYHQQQGKTFAEARMMLTPEQRRDFDSMTALESRTGRKERRDDTAVNTAGQTVDGEVIATKHTRTGEDLYVVKLAERVSHEDYTTLLSGAKRLGGWYSSFRGNGAVPGFQFKDRANAEAFRQLAGGDKTAAQEAAAARRDSFEDDRSQTAVERLNEMADRLEERADDDLSRDRKTNTERRARMAAGAEARAEGDKAMAKTMRNIAAAIEGGTAKFLDRVRQKVQVEFLLATVRTAKDAELRAKYESYIEQERHKDEPPAIETADFAEFPTYTAYRSDLASLGRRLLEVDGMKQFGQRIMKVADDVSAAYLKFAEEPGNRYKLSTFSIGQGEDRREAVFKNRDDAERAIKRSGLVGKAIVWQEKRGTNRIIMSPSEAMARGIWTGDGDKRITLSREFGDELVEKAGRRRMARDSVPWQFEAAHQRMQLLSRMGIETPAEFRAALREFIGMREAPKAPDKIKAMERAMIGRRADGLDFFPTPESTADEMIAAADIQPGMRVLEPSAGMGHIADRIREAGVEPAVVEMSGDRRELLEAKGYDLVGSDFMKLDEGGYDRIVMNPPFSDGRDIAHVRHAFDLLKPGGRIVAIIGEGAFFNSTKRAQEFRAWLEEVGGTDEKLAEGTFLDSALPVNTGVNARMVVIDKPAKADNSPMAARGPSDRFLVSKQSGRPVLTNRYVELGDSEQLGPNRYGWRIFSRDLTDEAGDPLYVGFVIADYRDGKFTALHRIEVDETLRGRGLGETVVASMLRHNGPGVRMEVNDIEHAKYRGTARDPLPFWRKMGVTITNFSSDPDIPMDGFITLEDYRDARQSGNPQADRGVLGEDAQARRDRDGAPQEGREGRAEAIRRIRSELVDAFGEDGVAALEASGLLHITTFSAAPTALKDALQADEFAAYWPGHGAYLFADNAAPGMAPALLLHEIGEHYGLEEMLGATRYAALLDEVKALHDKGDAGISAAWDHVRTYYADAPGSRRFVQEVIAKAGQDADVRRQSWWQRLLEDIRAFLLKIGMKKVGGERDLQVLLAASLRKAMNDAKEVRAVPMADVMAARLHHGTPHDVERFSTDKIGTGEGTQAYGWGLYFAENAGVAESYARKLSRGAMEVGGRVIPRQHPFNRTPESSAVEWVVGYGSVEKAIERLRYEMERWPHLKDRHERSIEVLQSMSRQSIKAATPKQYTVDIPDEVVGRMLLWDKPLSEQPKTVRATLEQVRQGLEDAGMLDDYLERENAEWGELTGAELYKQILNRAHLDDVLGLFDFSERPYEAASKYLDSIGIPGIKYLDGNSRSDGQGTNNVVVFNDKYITITHKDGKEVNGAGREAFVEEVMASSSGEPPLASRSDIATTVDALRAKAMQGLPLFARGKANNDDAIKAATEDLTPPRAGSFESPFGGDRPLDADLTLFRRIAVHPRMIAALEGEFGPVYRVAESQVQRRDELAAEILKHAQPYFDLPEESKRKVNAVLEIGRLQGRTFGGDELLQVMNMIESDAVLSQPDELITLAPREVRGYKAVRRAMDRALDLFAERMIEEFGQTGIVKSAAEAAALSVELAESNQRESNRLARLAEILFEVEQAKRSGYVPFTRWGEVGIAIKDDAGSLLAFERVEVNGVTDKARRMGENLLPSLFNTRRLAQIPAVKERLAALKARYPDAKVSVFRMDNPQAGAQVDLAALDSLAAVASIEPGQWEQVRQQLERAKQTAGFRRHFLGSGNVPGYSGDFERATADYILGIAGYLSRHEHTPRWERAIGDIDTAKSKLIEYAKRYRDYVNKPHEELQGLRQAAFFYFLSGVPSTAIVNLTQVPLITMPYLTQFANPVRVNVELARAYKDAMAMMTASRGVEMFDPEKAPADMLAAFRHAWEQGFFVPLSTYEIMGLAQNRSPVTRGLSKATRSVIDVVSLMFSIAERLNRMATFIAAHRLAREPGVRSKVRSVLSDHPLARQELRRVTPEVFAEWVIDETHYRMGKVNRPEMMRGVGAAVLQFKGFMLNTLELYDRMGRMHGREGKVAVALMLLLLWMSAGYYGLPGAEDWDDFLEFLMKRWKGMDYDTKAEARQAIAELTGSPKIAEVFLHGVPRLWKNGPELSARLGLGNVVPDSAKDVAGVPLSLTVGKAVQAGEYVSRGQHMLAAAELMPNFIRNPMTAWVWGREGIRSQSTGKVVVPPEKVTPGQQIQKAVGFTPSRVAEFRELQHSKNRLEHAVDEKRKTFYTRMARAQANLYRAEQAQDAKAAAAARVDIEKITAEVTEWNADADVVNLIVFDQRTMRQRVAEELAGPDARRRRKQSRPAAEKLERAYGLEE